MNKNVTAKDIAKYCNVSQATVSYVINNRTNEKISEATIKRISDAIKKFNYYPNNSARNMKKKERTSIGIVFAKDFSRQVFLNSLVGISEYFDKINYTITIYNEENNEIPKYVKNYYSNMIDGLIYISNTETHSFIEPAIKNGIPYVVICMDGVFSSKSPPPHAFDDVLRECAIFCKKNNLSKIRYFSIDNSGLFVNNKYPSFELALNEIYPKCDIQHIVCKVKKRNVDEFSKFFENYIDNNKFDIAISQNYDIGLVIQKSILKNNFSIPQKIKNIFLNYVDFYKIAYPSITGIKIPYAEMGTYAAKLIEAILSKKEDTFKYKVFKCTLVHGESTLV